tara:strand:+ start:296 stop:565 length:270 start_codon:yes stop_codon:yes gene_type:complete
MTLKAHRAPGGGLNEAGRRHHERKDGGNLKRPIKSGTNPRRVSFAGRFGGMKGAERKPDGEKTPLGKALSAWGFGSKKAARSFAARNKA